MVKNLSSININLLTVLYFLLQERNTTKVAKKLNISQSAVSYSLKQLRNIFEDDLLVRNSFTSHMDTTPLATELFDEVETAVHNVKKVFFRERFNPKTSKRTFKVAFVDSFLGLFLKDILLDIMEYAPNVNLSIFPVEAKTIKEKVEIKEIDIAFAAFNSSDAPGDLKFEHIIADKLVCNIRKEHPLAKNDVVTLEEYIKYPHIIVRRPKSIYEEEIELLRKENNNVNNIIIQSHFSAIEFLQVSDYIGLVGQRTSNYINRHCNTVSVRQNFLPEKLDYYACVLRSSYVDDGLKWLISLVKKNVKKTAKLFE